MIIENCILTNTFILKWFEYFFFISTKKANPYETSNVALALDRALKMPLEERQLRMFQLKKRERRMDVDAWVKSFLLEMDSIHGIPGKQSNILFVMSVWLKMTLESRI
jgi:hypothetical protein